MNVEQGSPNQRGPDPADAAVESEARYESDPDSYNVRLFDDDWQPAGDLR
jgi:hypothetical protein